MIELTHSYSAIKMYENCPKRYHHQRVLKEVTDKGNEITQWGERVHKMLEDRLAENTELPQEVVRYEPLCKSMIRMAEGGELLPEEEMTLNASLKPTGWWDADAWLRSKIDVLIIKDGVGAMFDWKTGKRRPDPSQLELFALQVFTHRQDVKKINTSFVWLKDLTMDSKSYTRADIPELWEKLLGKIARIEQSAKTDNWPARPSGLCNFCPCKSFCEYV
jgi:hypothetical protein